jgi:uncharacterized membrane protein YkvA (DUF1232 family)
VDLPLWAQIALVLIAIWVILAVVLVVLGRAVLARELTLLLPNLVRLFGGLMRDGRVPLRAKVVIGVASLWLASPIDLVPEFIPIVGSLDDAIVAGLALRFLVRTTDVSVIREHWRGDVVTLDRVLRVVTWGSRGARKALP